MKIKDCNRLSLLCEGNVVSREYISTRENEKGVSFDEIKRYYDSLNKDNSHKLTSDDICTPIECVKKMIDYVPEELWRREAIKVLDPCCGNGNFGAYCMFKTDIDNIYFNEINYIRYENCRRILNPKHIYNGDAFRIKDKYDLVMANPPYSGGGNKNRSLSNDFMEHSIDILNYGGYLCFITPNNWMTYNNNNTTLKKLLLEGSFVVIDNNAKRYFPSVGSSFTIFVWQKGVLNNSTKIVNNYLLKDVQENVLIPKDIPFIPLYISQPVLDIIHKCIKKENNKFNYRCDLHNYTKKDFLRDEQDNVFRYETIHTPNKTRYASIKQDIYDKWIIIVPLSTYYIPYIMHNVNTTQSVGYFAFDTEREAKNYLRIITRDCFKVIIHLTRYGNFNNIMVLKHINFDNPPKFTMEQQREIAELASHIRY